ncbi:hypothetical protein BDW75DRAFT_237340 [Aspergillus navahoensis]
MEDLNNMWTYVHSRLNIELKQRSLTPVDLEAVFISGGSAGGYITFQAGHLLTPPAGLIAMYVLKRTFGVKYMQEAASRPDLYYLFPHSVLFPQFSVQDSYSPIVLAHGTGDTTVPYEQSVFFSEHLTSKGFYNELYLLEGKYNFWDLGEEDDVLEVKAKIWAFLDKLASH